MKNYFPELFLIKEMLRKPVSPWIATLSDIFKIVKEIEKIITKCGPYILKRLLLKSI